jgi:hypothetical protein
VHAADGSISELVYRLCLQATIDQRQVQARADAPAAPVAAALRDAEIRFACPHCGMSLKGKPEQAGKAVKCPAKHCAQAFLVPG